MTPTISSSHDTITFTPSVPEYTKPWLALCRPDHEARQGYVLEFCNSARENPGTYHAGPVQQVGDILAAGYTDEIGTKQRAYFELNPDWQFVRLTNQAFVQAMQRQGSAGVLKGPSTSGDVSEVDLRASSETSRAGKLRSISRQLIDIAAELGTL